MADGSCSALLLFGATGDLSRRMLLPSLYALHEDGLIAPGLRIVGTARSAHDDAEFREFARLALDEFLPADRKDETKLASFLDRLEYQTLDASDIDGFAALADKLGDTSGGLSIFLSTAPALFEPTIEGCAARGWPMPTCGSALKSRWATIWRRAAASTTRWQRALPRTRFSASTTIWARKPSRT
jgi:glucose-6-phosphate 1-dehydrogenase